MTAAVIGWNFPDHINDDVTGHARRHWPVIGQLPYKWGFNTDDSPVLASRLQSNSPSILPWMLTSIYSCSLTPLVTTDHALVRLSFPLLAWARPPSNRSPSPQAAPHNRYVERSLPSPPLHQSHCSVVSSKSTVDSYQRPLLSFPHSIRINTNESHIAMGAFKLTSES